MQLEVLIQVRFKSSKVIVDVAIFHHVIRSRKGWHGCHTKVAEVAVHDIFLLKNEPIYLGKGK